MSFLAPYTNAMRLGQGYNSYSQEICIDGAVEIKKRDTPSPPIEQLVGANPGPNVLAATMHGHAAAPFASASQSSAAATNGVPPSTADAGEKSVKASPSAIDTLWARLYATDSGLADELAKTYGADVPSDLKAHSKDNGPKIVDTGAAGMVDAAAKALNNVSDKNSIMPYDANSNFGKNQIVSYSTRSVSNISDIVDALNISSSASIKYGTITGNASASFVNEDKVNSSDINYILTVKVTNTGTARDQQGMEFKELPHMLERLKKGQETGQTEVDQRANQVYNAREFTKVYDFIEGGELSAVISIKVSDKSKLTALNLAASASLAVGPSPLSVGGGAKFDKGHEEALADSEISISVNWVGGGEIKKPNAQWTLPNLVLIANAFPSLVARNYTKTSAVLTPYTSLRSFKEWQFNNNLDFKPLDYSTCTLYTEDLFSAYMSYKLIWKKINNMLRERQKYVTRRKKLDEDIPNNYTIQNKSSAPVGTRPLSGSNSPAAMRIPSPSAPNGTITPASDASNTENSYEDQRRTWWSVDELNNAKDPISTSPLELNKARLICREAMTLITQEVADLVENPHFAKAEWRDTRGAATMKLPEYPYPEILDSRLPLSENEAADNDPDGVPPENYTIIPSRVAMDPNYHVSNFFGEEAPQGHKHQSFFSLDLAPHHTDRILHLSLHAHKPSLWHDSQFSKDAAGAIGGIGFAFSPVARGNVGATPRQTYHTANGDMCTHYTGTENFESRRPPRYTAPLYSSTGPSIEIVRVLVHHVPGSGRIDGVEFFPRDGRMAVLDWFQNGKGKSPDAITDTITQPEEDGPWTLAGLAGMWDEPWFGGRVLAKIGVIWKKV